METTGQVLTDIAATIGQALEACLERGMTLPFVVAAMSPNSSVLCMRYDKNKDGDGLTATPLAEHYDQAGFVLPINIMIADQTGEAVRVTVTHEGPTTFH